MTKTPKDKNKYSEIGKLKKEELLELLEFACNFFQDQYPHSPNRELLNNVEQAYIQIKEMIQTSSNLRNKSLGKLAQDLGVSFSAAKIIHDHAQPTVTEEDIRGWAEEAWDRSRHTRYRIEGIEEAMEEMLTELGVSITVDRGNKQTIVASKYNDRKV